MLTVMLKADTGCFMVSQGSVHMYVSTADCTIVPFASIMIVISIYVTVCYGTLSCNAPHSKAMNAHVPPVQLVRITVALYMTVDASCSHFPTVGCGGVAVIWPCDLGHYICLSR